MLKIAHRLGGVHLVGHSSYGLSTWCGHTLTEPEYWREARGPVDCPTCRQQVVAQEDRDQRAMAALIEFLMQCPTEPYQKSG